MSIYIMEHVMLLGVVFQLPVQHCSSSNDICIYLESSSNMLRGADFFTTNNWAEYRALLLGLHGMKMYNQIKLLDTDRSFRKADGTCKARSCCPRNATYFKGFIVKFQMAPSPTHHISMYVSNAAPIHNFLVRLPSHLISKDYSST